MISNKLMTVLEKIMYGCLLNVFWLLGTIVGLGIFGIGPASYALAKTISQKELFTNQASLFKLLSVYAKEYKMSFLKANSVFLIYLITISILIINYRIVMLNQILQSIFIIPIILMGLYCLSTLFTSMVVSIYTEGTLKEKIKLTLLSPLIMPSLFMFNIIFLCLVSFITYVMPITIVLISVTLFITGILFINLNKLQKKHLVIDYI
ncbi:DUF624 domain-containing protein [Marinilactibacillus kalidii]|uniref:DUF624 domain-containing protein n=1 Tax=Marinilactibacillus kalidii TaxID=2820274 RepID=UPI001ABDFD04|nr:DUF624 domain-containing protein [Marinilactibacillus kalidii]